MAKSKDPKQYNLEERTLAFAKRAVRFCRVLPKTAVDAEIGKQLMRSCTSVGANYIEANESLGKKDFLMRIKICRKEAKESGYWLKPIEALGPDLKTDRRRPSKNACN
ncbi:MAG: four helix bundle protein [Dehalococcoidia bacterium]|nr:four helix bundle protein [Dehalococcoidia bacterium]